MTAWKILEQIETMLDLAETAELPPHLRRLMLDAKAEAEKVIRAEGGRVTS